MKAFFTVAALILGLFALMPNPASAGEVRQCGKPDVYDVSPGDFVYCDIHDRRFAYREEAIKLREQMKLRQQRFREPNRQAIENYKARESSLNFGS